MNKTTIEEIIEKNGKYLSTTVGDSMEPLLRHRSNTVVIKRAEQPLKKYDVPLYRRPDGKYVLHRIVAVREKKGYYSIVGDNRWKKEKVPFSWIVGVMEGYYEGDRYISVEDEDYLKYVRKLTRNYPFRAIRLIGKRIFGYEEKKKFD